jgi:lysophospholipase L1-like esterase
VSAEVPDRTGHRVPAAAPNGVDQTTEYITHPWMRYVALGDSFTEGVGDPEEGIKGPLFRGPLD